MILNYRYRSILKRLRRLEQEMAVTQADLDNLDAQVKAAQTAFDTLKTSVTDEINNLIQKINNLPTLDATALTNDLKALSDDVSNTTFPQAP